MSNSEQIIVGLLTILLIAFIAIFSYNYGFYNGYTQNISRIEEIEKQGK